MYEFLWFWVEIQDQLMQVQGLAACPVESAPPGFSLHCQEKCSHDIATMWVGAGAARAADASVAPPIVISR